MKDNRVVELKKEISLMVDMIEEYVGEWLCGCYEDEVFMEKIGKCRDKYNDCFEELEVLESK